jgi:hypothetical protein
VKARLHHIIDGIAAELAAPSAKPDKRWHGIRAAWN